MSDSLFECQDVSFEYRIGRVRYRALDGISLTIAKGSFVAFAGPSGSGKSTLLNILGMIEEPQSGLVAFEGIDLKKATRREKNQLRRHKLGFIFQNFNLIDVLTAAENVEYFLARLGLPLRERKRRVEETLCAVGLWEQRHKRPMEMSGGQRQRVAVARAVAKEPYVILADEPTASLDQKTGREIMELLRTFHEQRGMTIVMASHDTMALRLAKTVLPIQDGRLLAAEYDREHRNAG